MDEMMKKSIGTAANGKPMDAARYGPIEAPAAPDLTIGMHASDTSSMMPFVIGPIMIAMPSAPQLRSDAATASSRPFAARTMQVTMMVAVLMRELRRTSASGDRQSSGCCDIICLENGQCITWRLQGCQPNTQSFNCDNFNGNYWLLEFRVLFCVLGCFSIALIGTARQPIRWVTNAASALVHHHY